MGASGFDLQIEVDAVIRTHLTSPEPSAFRRKRRRLSHWSPELGGHSGETEIYLNLKGGTKKPWNACWRNGSVYIADRGNCGILRWKGWD